VDALADLGGLTGLDVPLDLERVVAVGHSAGGHLALWLAARPGLPAGTPGAEPRMTVAAAVSLAGVADLVAGAERRLGRVRARSCSAAVRRTCPTGTRWPRPWRGCRSA
jgi:acetyl esterase/lipase